MNRRDFASLLFAGGLVVAGGLTADLAFKPRRASTVGLRTEQIFGTIRNTGSGWQWIDDAGHIPYGVTTVTASATAITINHPIGAVAVGSFDVGVDETLDGLGYSAGISGGIDHSVITLRRGPGTSRPAVDPRAVVSSSGNLWIIGILWVPA